MKEKTDKILTLVMLAVAVLATVFTVLFDIDNGSKDSLADLENPATFDIAYFILLALIGLAIIGILVFLVVKMVNRFMSNKNYWVKFLIVSAICVAVVVVSYLLSSGTDVPAEFLEKNDNTSQTVSKLIGTACIMVYILAAGAIVSILFTEIAKTFKKR